KNTWVTIRVAALNIKGRGSRNLFSPKHKWARVNRLMFEKRIGVLALGETHLSDEQTVEINENHVFKTRLHVLSSTDPDEPNKKGIAIAINKQLTNVDGVKTWRLIPGRAILVQIPWHGGRTLTILAVYAPAESMMANKLFWEQLYDIWMSEGNLPVPDMFLGDMNVVEDPIDRMPHRADDARATYAYARFKRLLGMKDGWRVTNPDEKAYTYAHTTGDSMSRIDRINVSEESFRSCRSWDIHDMGDLTDHRMVSVDVSAPGAPYIGRGRYVIPLYMLKDKLFMQYAVTEGCKLEEDSQENIQVRWKEYKDRLRDFARVRAKESTGALDQKKKKLERERTAVLNNGAFTQKLRAEKASVIQREVDKIVSVQSSKNRMATKIRYRNELDNITSFTVRVNKDHKPRDTLSFLQRTDTTPPIGSTRSEDMAELARDYHNEVQQDPTENDREVKNTNIEEVLQYIDDDDPAPGMEELEEELTEDLVLQSIKASAKGKAPGMDGIHTEMWDDLHKKYVESMRQNASGSRDAEQRKTFNVLKTMTAVYNDIERRNRIEPGTEFSKGW
ncbi:Endonuclease/exonuclease/phosphatase, partial [Mycena filopes]